MKKLITSVLFFLIFLNIFLTPNNIFAHEANQTPESVDVYAVFWPVVPGKTVAEPMFWFKQLKERFNGFFKFGNVAQSGYHIELSEKRLVEAAKLLEDEKYSHAKKSLALNKSNRDQALSLKKKAQEEKANVSELTLKLVKSLENQQKALVFLETQFPEDQHEEIEKMVQDLTLQISEAK